jgi:LysR family glycine cleavage system transcriptional activator
MLGRRRNLPPLMYLQAFEAAARHNSFTGAAHELGCTQAAISQRIRGLETHLGRKLFERRRNGVVLTEAGEAYLPGVSEALNIAEAATEGLKGKGVRRTVTLSGPSSFLNLWLIPRLPDLLGVREDIELRLNSAIWTDPHAELADILVEVRESETNACIAYMPEERLVLVCAPGLASVFAQKDPAQALSSLRHLHVQGRYDLWSRWAEALHLPSSAATNLKFDTAVSALEAARLGLGPAVVYASYAERYLKTGELVAPLGEGVPTPLSHCIVKGPVARPQWHPAHKVLEWLTSMFTQQPRI